MDASDCPPVTLSQALECLSSMPAFLDEALSRGRDRLARRPAGGGFSLVEHACHLRDLEREGYSLRVKRILEEDQPALEGFEGERIAAERDYRSQDARAAAAQFAAERAGLVRTVQSLREDELCRTGVFAGRTVTLADVVLMAAGHDEEHRTDIERLLAQGG
jgi:hypothetical protein